MEDDDNELLLDQPLDEGDDAPSDMETGDDGDIHIEIEGEEGQAEDEGLPKHLRAEIRERDKRIRELERANQPAAIDPGPKPTLDDCEWDPDKYEAALLKWNDDTRKAEQAKQATTQATQTQQQEFERIRGKFFTQAATLGLKDPEAAINTVSAALSPQHAGFIMKYAKNPAVLMAALHKNPALLDSVANEPDEMKQLVILAQMEAKVKVTRKGPPPPEAATIQRGSSPLSGSVDKTLAALEKTAERTGDRSKLIAYRAQLKQKGK